MITAGIIGGTGYTAGELIRLLLWHPEVNLSFVHSGKHVGKALASIHTDLIGEIDLVFTPYQDQEVDVLFLCLPHGASAPFLAKHSIDPTVKIIDLSRDFRLKKEAHDFIYGLPELYKSQIKESQKIANCGCFATALQLALLPLAKAQLLQHDIHIHALTGSTGAGKSLGDTTHFSWRTNNVSVYKAFRHQHLDEIKQSIQDLQADFDQEINFIPVRGNFSRGIFASIYLEMKEDLETIQELYNSFYEDAPFVFITETNPDLKQVVNTNKCLIHLEKHDNKLLIISALDNLLKGASGQAVQNMNLLFGFKETLGLQLKAVAF